MHPTDLHADVHTSAPHYFAWRHIGLDIQKQRSRRKSQFDSRPKKADFTVPVMLEIACFGQLVRGTPLEAFVHICIWFCISTAFNAITDGNTPLGPCLCNQKLCFLIVFACFQIRIAKMCCENATNPCSVLFWLKITLYNFMPFSCI